MLLMKMTEKSFNKITEYERNFCSKYIAVLISNYKTVPYDWPLSVSPENIGKRLVF